MFESLIYHPKTYSTEDFRRLTGLRLSILPTTMGDLAYIEIGNGDTVCIYCYGNACTILESLDVALRYSQRHGVKMVLMDYPGYGASEGQPTEISTTRALYEISRRYPEVHLMGESIGTGVVLSFMAYYPSDNVKSVTLFSPFKNLSRVAIDSLIVELLYSFIGTTFYDNMSNIQSVKVPILMVALENDDVIPVEHSRKLTWLVPCEYLEHSGDDISHGEVALNYCHLLDFWFEKM